MCSSDLKTVAAIVSDIANASSEQATGLEQINRALNQIESSFFSRMERVGGFGGKADQLNAYYEASGNPDWFNEDLARYRALSPSDVRAAAQAFLPPSRRVELIVAPAAPAAPAAPKEKP